MESSAAKPNVSVPKPKPLPISSPSPVQDLKTSSHLSTEAGLTVVAGSLQKLSPRDSTNALPADDQRDEDVAKVNYLQHETGTGKRPRAATEQDAGPDGCGIAMKGQEPAKIARESSHTGWSEWDSKREENTSEYRRQYRMVNFEGFKNRFSNNEQIYALDVLVSHGDLRNDIRREMLTRLLSSEPQKAD